MIPIPRVAVAVVILTASASAIGRPACACQTKRQVYRSTLKSALYVLALAEGDYRERVGHFTTDVPMLVRDSFAFGPPGAVTISVRLTGIEGWTAEARHRDWSGFCTTTGSVGEPPRSSACVGDVGQCTGPLGPFILVGLVALVFILAIWRRKHRSIATAGHRGISRV
jgi:hypothetical protein